MQWERPGDALTTERREFDLVVAKLVFHTDYSRDVVKAILQCMGKRSVWITFGRFAMHERDRADGCFSAWCEQQRQSLLSFVAKNNAIPELKRHNGVVGMKVVEMICLK